jgi:hypothetical protein
MTVIYGKIKKKELIREKSRNNFELTKSHSLTSLNPRLKMETDKKNQEALVNKKKTAPPKLRAAVLTLLSYTLEQYDLENLHNVRTPINILFGHLLSSE